MKSPSGGRPKTPLGRVQSPTHKFRGKSHASTPSQIKGLKSRWGDSEAGFPSMCRRKWRKKRREAKKNNCTSVGVEPCGPTHPPHGKRKISELTVCMVLQFDQRGGGKTIDPRERIKWFCRRSKDDAAGWEPEKNNRNRRQTTGKKKLKLLPNGPVDRGGNPHKTRD